MVLGKYIIRTILICLIVMGLIFSITGCKFKKHASNEDVSSSPPSNITAIQPDSSAYPSHGQTAPPSGSLGSSLNPTGSADASQQPGQNTVTYGAYALWTGKWETTFFRYGGSLHTTIWDLKQVESNVTGTYDWDNGKLTCRQSKSGGYLIGAWSESPTYQPPNDAGDLELQQSVDGNSFTGKWRYGSSGDWVGEWNGKRIR
jgi:hypothetical protein